MNRTFVLFSMTLILSNISFANAEIPLARFSGPIETLKSTLDDYDGSEASVYEIANKMLYGPRRVAAFQLQALGQIYQKYPTDQAEAFFKHTLRFSAKALEDAIGGYDKWDEIIKDLEKKNGSKAQIATARHHKDLAFHILVLVLSGKKHPSLQNIDELGVEEKKFLERYNKGKTTSLLGHLEWLGTSPTLLQGLQQKLQSWPWQAPLTDREYVIKRLRKHLKNLNETTFNFALLEDTETEKGLHEFRREVRWFSFQAGVLNGTINFYDTFMEEALPQCPNPQLAPLTDPSQHPELASSPYTKLPFTKFATEKVCGISRCLYYKLTKIVSDIGKVKDQVEKGNFAKNNGNQTPTWAVSAVQDIYDDMKTSRVVDHLRDQLKACY